MFSLLYRGCPDYSGKRVARWEFGELGTPDWAIIRGVWPLILCQWLHLPLQQCTTAPPVAGWCCSCCLAPTVVFSHQECFRDRYSDDGMYWCHRGCTMRILLNLVPGLARYIPPYPTLSLPATSSLLGSSRRRKSLDYPQQHCFHSCSHHRYSDPKKSNFTALDIRYIREKIEMISRFLCSSRSNA